MRWIALFALVGCAAAGAVVSESSPVPALTAAQIVDKNVAARGGLEAWRKIQTMVWMGHMQSEHAPLPVMEFNLQQQRPNRMRFEINAMGQRTVRVFDGAHGWKARAGHSGKTEAQPYSMQEATYAFRAPGIDGPLIDYQAKGASVALESLDEIEGRKAYRLAVTLASGEVDHVWVDAQSFLEIRYDRPSYSTDKKSATVTVFFHDFKPVEGWPVQVPMMIETPGGPGRSPDKMMIDRVILNTPLDDATFAEPGTKPRHHGGLPVNRSGAGSAVSAQGNPAGAGSAPVAPSRDPAPVDPAVGSGPK